MDSIEQRQTGFRVLSIDGGGYLGLATAAFIHGIENHEGIRFADKFDLFCGTSTGAIIALALANGRSGEDLVGLYKRLGPSVFPTSWWGSSRRHVQWLAFSKYGGKKLRIALEDEFGEHTLADLQARQKCVLIPSFNMTTGSPRLFKTDHSANLSRDSKYKLVDVAMASTAAPTYLPISKLTHAGEGSVEYFCDGGVAANHPALLGFVEATYELGHSPCNVQVLSISTPQQDLSVRRVKFRSRGVLGWSKPLAAIFTGSNSFLSHQTLRRLVSTYPDPKPRYERIELSNNHRLAMDCTSRHATDTLVQHGAHIASSNDARERIRSLLTGG